MRTAFFLLAGTALLAGCTGKHEAKNGKEFFEKWTMAMKAKDVETIWKMHSRKTQEYYKSQISLELQNAKPDKERMAKLLAEFKEVPWKGDGEKDLTKIGADILWKHRLKTNLEKEYALREFRDARYLEDQKDGNNTVMVLEGPGRQKLYLVLTPEGGYLKYDSQETVRYNRDRTKK